MTKKKVLHIITRLIIGGAQENTLFTVEGFQSDDAFEAELLTGPPIGPEGQLLDRAEKKRIRYYVFPWLRRNINPLYDLLAFLKLYLFLKKKHYDIVHTHSSKAGIIGRLAARAAGVPVVVHTIHGLPFHRYESGLANFIYITLERLCAAYTDRIITVADSMTVQAVEKKVASRDKFITIYSGMEVANFRENGEGRRSIREHFGIADGDIVIGKIARLFRLKGQEYLIRAFAKLPVREKNLRLMLIGDGILKDKFEKMCVEAGIRDRVIFTGLVSPDKVGDYISALDIVVHTSLREGLARILPQALIAKKPVVTFDIDGASEIIEDGMTGFLVPPENIEVLTERLKYLLDNPGIWGKLAEEGYRRAMSRFPVEIMVREIKKLYIELINKKER